VVTGEKEGSYMCDLEDWHESKHNPAVDKTIEWHVNRRNANPFRFSAVMDVLMKKHNLTITQAMDALDHFADHQSSEESEKVGEDTK
jgi:hypothetical protein